MSGKCRHCGHLESDHDGYGGLCDGLGFNESREVCGCEEFVFTHKRQPRRRKLRGGEADTPENHSPTGPTGGSGESE